MKSESLPEPLAVVHSIMDFKFDTPKRFVHQEHIISILLKGTGRYWTGKCELPMGQPIAALLPAGDDDINGLVGPGESRFSGFHWPGVKFDSDGSREFGISAFGKSISVPRYKRVSPSDAARFTECFARLQTAFARQDVSGAIRSRALLMELFAMYLEFPDEDGQFVGHRALARFCELLQAHCCDDVNIEQIAEEAGITADHLRDLFRARFGMRPVEYRTGLRLSKARQLLSSTTMNVKEVAHKVGYPDALYFSRVFKEHFGVSPREMIQRFRLPAIGP